MTAYIDQQTIRTLRYLAERPLQYDAGRPIRSIESVIAMGLADATKPQRVFQRRAWLDVVLVSITQEGRAVLERTK